MKKRKLFLILAITATLLYAGISEVNAMGKIKIIPEPSLSDIRNDDWSVDVSRMIAYYDGLFNGMSSADIVSILEGEDVQFKFISDSEIQFIPRKTFLPMLTSYMCVVVIEFESGMFKSIKSIDMCGLLAP